MGKNGEKCGKCGIFPHLFVDFRAIYQKLLHTFRNYINLLVCKIIVTRTFRISLKETAISQL